MRRERPFRWRWVPFFVLMLQMLGTGAEARESPRYEFRIEEKTLGAALQAISRVTGAQLLYPHEFGKATGINPVVGRYTVSEALTVLLRSSGFSGGLTDSGMIVISLKQNEGADMPDQLQESLKVQEASAGKRSVLRGLATFLMGGLSVAQAQQGAETEPAQLEEITVTAQKRAQSLSDVSLSVSAVGADALANSQTNSIESLQYLVPSISFGNDFNFAKLFIRGIGLNSSFPGADPSVALHVDGAVIAQAGAQMSAMFDLERVEVLRGPQGTLYGRNATGGAVNLITAKPTESLQSYARLTLGGEDLQALAEGAVSGPLSESIRGRVAVRYLDREGYGVNELTGRDIDDAKQLSGRVSLEFAPGEDFDLLLTAEYHREDDQSNALKFRAAAFPNATAPAPGQVDLRSLATLPGYSVASDPRNVRANVDPINDRTTYAFTATAAYELADAWTIRSISNYRDYEAEFYQDFDVSDYTGCRQPMVGPTTTCTIAAGLVRTSGNHWQPLYQHQLSEELQLSYDSDRVHGLVAGYYLKEHIRIENHLGFNPVPAFSSDLRDVRAIFDGTMDVDTWAVFGNLTYDFTEKFSVKTGARYSWEEREVISFQATATPPQSAPVPSALGYPWVRKKDWSNFSPQLGLEFRPQEGLMTYVNWAKGFKSGTSVIGEAGKEFVDPEKVDSYEIGLKSRLLDDRLQVNLAGFYHEVEDAQFQFTFPLAVPPNFTTQMRNAAQIEAKGVELETSWRLARAFTLDASLAWLDSKFTSFLAPNPLNPAGYTSTSPDTAILEDLTGNRTRMSPEWSFSVHPTYDFALTNGATLTLSANAVYKGKQYHTEFNDERLASDAYTLLDANILYTSPGDRYTLNLWGKNLTDEFVWAGSYAVASTRTIGGTLLPPRTYGVTAGVKF
jgi:iron complex outermembrane receptor protein